MSLPAATTLSSPPDLGFVPELIDREAEFALIAAMDASGMASPSYDPTGRASKSFGWVYDAAIDAFVAGEALPAAFEAARARAAEFAGIPEDDCVQCLLNRYDPGTHIPFHFDKGDWEYVVGISLGGAAVMNFRKDTGRGFHEAAVLLQPRSAYILRGAARHEYQHGIAHIPERRWSITFRTRGAD